MATSHLPPPPQLEIHDANAAKKWKKFEQAWRNYARATELSKKDEIIQDAKLLTVKRQGGQRSLFDVWRLGERERQRENRTSVDKVRHVLQD